MPTDERDWHGWSTAKEAYKGEAIHVGPLPGRKSICLYSVDYSHGAVMKVHAYFRSEQEAVDFLAALDRLVEHMSRSIHRNGRYAT